MRISGAAGGGGELTGSQKTAIERQIRKLEAKRDEILEKLGVKKSSGKQDTVDIAAGTLRVASTESAGQESASTPQFGGDGTESAAAAPQAIGVSQDFGKALRELVQTGSSSSAEFESSEDPEELMKQLQLIEMQIIALRQQMGDDSLAALEVDTGQAAELAAIGMSAREADKAAASAPALPAAEVTAGGHVDGYA